MSTPQTSDTPVSLQRKFWNEWNAQTREHALDEVSIRQANVVCAWLDALDRKDLAIIEVGCGAGWLSPRLAHYGRVTATDLADEVLERAQRRVPEVRYIAGDFAELDLGSGAFDVAVTLEVLSHVADQKAFIRKLASLLRPGGCLMLATQNRPVLQRFNRVPPTRPGWLRHWVDRHELRALLQDDFEILELFSVTPRANRGIMRFVHSRKINWPVRAVFGDRVEKLKEAMWLGWTLMALARRAAATNH